MSETALMESYQIGDIQQLRNLLTQITLENQLQSIDIPLDLGQKDTQQLQDLVNNNYLQMASQVTKKQQTLTNVISFASHLLKTFQETTLSNNKLKKLHQQLQKDFKKLLTHNQELSKHIQEIEDLNTDIKNRMQETETYMSECSNGKSSSFSDRLNISPYIQPLSLVLTPQNHFTQRIGQRKMTQTKTEQQSKYEEIIQEKNITIQELQKQISFMSTHIFHLEQQLSMKKSQFQLSEVFFKQKLSQAKQQIKYCSQLKNQISSFDAPHIYSRELSRVSSAKSIDSIVESQSQNNIPSQQSVKSNEEKQKQNRRSLRDDFLIFQPLEEIQKKSFAPFQDLFIDSICQSSEQTTQCRPKKHSISICTQEKVKMCTKAIQVESKTYQRKSRKSSISSITSINNEADKFNMTNSSFSSFDILMKPQSMMSNLVKNIFNCATEKLVTSRIKSKKHQVYHKNK